MRKTAVVKPANDGYVLSCGDVTLWFPSEEQAVAYSIGRHRNCDVEIYDENERLRRRIEAEKPSIEAVSDWLNRRPR